MMKRRVSDTRTGEAQARAHDKRAVGRSLAGRELSQASGGNYHCPQGDPSACIAAGRGH